MLQTVGIGRSSLAPYRGRAPDGILVAPERSRRPGEHAAAGRSTWSGAGSCPLCPGHENATPPEVWRLGSADGDWRVPVVPNRFPLLRPAGGGRRRRLRSLAGDAAHALETLPAMLGVIVAVVAGVLAALVAGWLGASMPVVVTVASAVFLLTVVLLAVFIRRDFDTFAAAMPTRFLSAGRGQP